jgi:hypothetical protein
MLSIGRKARRKGFCETREKTQQQRDQESHKIPRGKKKRIMKQ